MLPDGLKKALDARLEGISRTALAERAAAISLRYRTGQGSAAAIRDATDALAYAVARMPATYAAVAAALGRLAERWPDFTPSTLVDLGAGPGTATYAAFQTWPSLSAIQQIEGNAQFRSFSETLAADAGIGGIAFTPADVTAAAIPEADLAISAYVLVEIPEPAIERLVLRALESCRALVLVEPGNLGLGRGHQGLRRHGIAQQFARALQVGARARHLGGELQAARQFLRLECRLSGFALDA